LLLLFARTIVSPIVQLKVYLTTRNLGYVLREDEQETSDTTVAREWHVVGKFDKFVAWNREQAPAQSKHRNWLSWTRLSSTLTEPISDEKRDSSLTRVENELSSTRKRKAEDTSTSQTATTTTTTTGASVATTTVDEADSAKRRKTTDTTTSLSSTTTTTKEQSPKSALGKRKLVRRNNDDDDDDDDDDE
jgi:hypothetical protein